MLPCVLFEDEHLLVVNKPAGLNTHSPAPFAGEGLYDWLRHREPRWASLALIHRLDKDTSGVMVFSKTPLANRSLTDQFAQGKVRKNYVLLTDRPVRQARLAVVSALVRVGERYLSRPLHAGAERAETRFTVVKPGTTRQRPTLVVAEPLTGRTHQIRVHAAEEGFPVLGDTLYGGTPAPRLCLHSTELTLRHPATGAATAFRAPAEFELDPRLALREALIDPAETNAFRLIHGAADGWPGWYVDRLGDLLLSQSERALSPEQKAEMERLLAARFGGTASAGAYHKLLTRHVRSLSQEMARPQVVLGPSAPDRFTIRENGVQFELSFNEGYSVGLFLDQRDNRWRFLTGHVAADFPLRVPGSEFRVLNCFAYTCGFSVCAALAGARTTSVDLSRKSLDWGRRNFALNGLDPAAHGFIHGDAFDWLRRLAKKARTFDAIALDPPTFSQSKEHGVFRAEKDFGKLVAAALPLLRPEGVLFASTNAATLRPDDFLLNIEGAIRAAGRRIVQQHYAPRPADFPVTRSEPACLKTVWLRVD
jgi:23S rRNA (cytosine1962-C5)-methyltransferase